MEAATKLIDIRLLSFLPVFLTARYVSELARESRRLPLVLGLILVAALSAYVYVGRNHRVAPAFLSLGILVAGPLVVFASQTVLRRLSLAAVLSRVGASWLMIFCLHRIALELAHRLGAVPSSLEFAAFLVVVPALIVGLGVTLNAWTRKTFSLGTVPLPGA